MEDRLQDGLQVSLDNFLSDPVPDRCHAPIELHSVATDLWDRLKSSTRFTHHGGNGLLF
jgi:hypothetical protein